MPNLALETTVLIELCRIEIYDFVSIGFVDAYCFNRTL